MTADMPPVATPTPAPAPMTAEQVHQNSIDENLHDEQQIKLMNAELLLQKERNKNVEGYDHVDEVFTKELHIMGGCSKHFEAKVTVIKIEMREKFLQDIKSGKKPREALTDAANVGVEGLGELMGDGAWINEQTDHFQTLIDENFDEGLGKKAVKGVKRLVFSPVKLTTWAGDKVLRIISLGKIGLKKKEKHVA